MKNSLVVLVGVSGSGKSRYASKQIGYEILSSDAVRLELFGDLKHQKPEHHELVFKTIYTRLEDNVSYNYIFDATNLSRKKRKILYERFRKDYNIHVVLFIEPLQQLYVNNRSKPEEEQVSEEVIKNMYLRLDVPKVNVDCDSYEVVSQSRFLRTGTTMKDLLRCRDYDSFTELVTHHFLLEMNRNYESHDSPYHLENINTHIDMCLETVLNLHSKNEIESWSERDVYYLAALIHDLGKSVAKNGGSYIGHSNVSAQYAALIRRDLREIEYWPMGLVQEIVFQHMREITPKVVKRYKLEDIRDHITFFRERIDHPSRIAGENYDSTSQE